MNESSGKKTLLVRELLGQVALDHGVETPFRERLLLGAHAHVKQLIARLDPRFMGLEERVVLERVLGALDVDRL